MFIYRKQGFEFCGYNSNLKTVAKNCTLINNHLSFMYMIDFHVKPDFSNLSHSFLKLINLKTREKVQLALILPVT